MNQIKINLDSMKCEKFQTLMEFLIAQGIEFQGFCTENLNSKK